MTGCDMVTSPSEAIHMSQFGEFELSENIFQKKNEKLSRFYQLLRKKPPLVLRQNFHSVKNGKNKGLYTENISPKTTVLA
jgi:hypothetical protein